MENEIIVCPACGEQVSLDKNFCTSCGYFFEKMKKAQDALDNDPDLVRLNKKYAKNKCAKMIWSTLFFASLGVIYMWLEHNWFDGSLEFVVNMSFLGIPISLIAWIITGMKVSRVGKKIEKGLEDRVGKSHIDISTP